MLQASDSTSPPQNEKDGVSISIKTVGVQGVACFNFSSNYLVVPAP